LTEDRDSERDEARGPLRQLIGSTLVSLRVVLISMIPALQFDNWQWLALQLATPVMRWKPGRSTALRWRTCGSAAPYPRRFDRLGHLLARGGRRVELDTRDLGRVVDGSDPVELAELAFARAGARGPPRAGGRHL
jgi:hypothetical protein